jgi:hypothetical protein
MRGVWHPVKFIAVGSIVVVLASLGGGRSGLQLVHVSAAQTLPIQHVVVIMQENRSFDSYFGTFPGADGIPMQNGVPSICVPDPATSLCVGPYHDPTTVTSVGRTANARQPSTSMAGRWTGLSPRRCGPPPGVRCDAGPAVQPERPDRRDGLPRSARNSQLLDLRSTVCPPGPHV